jgi:Ca2+-binding EF-hand superfamily protein
LRLACKFICKQFDIDVKRVRIPSFTPIGVPWQEQELMKYMLENDTDNSGTLDFEEFKVAIKMAQKKLKDRIELED